MYPPKKRAAQKATIGKEDGPKVGILFVVRNLILIESTDLARGELYGDFIGHERGHEQFWEDLQAQGRVPRDVDYVEVPRGRVTFSSRTGQYLLLLDRCILRQPKLVREIRRRLNLPSRGLQVSSDGHYRCAVCMSRSSF